MILPYKTPNGHRFTIEKERDGSFSLFSASVGYITGGFVTIPEARLFADNRAGC